LTTPNSREVDINQCCVGGEEDQYDQCHRFSVPKWTIGSWLIWGFMTFLIIIVQIVVVIVIVNQLKVLIIDYDKLPFFHAAQMSKGVISIGQISVGFIAIGQFAVGFIAIGQLGVGVINISMLGAGILGCVAMMGASCGFGVGIGMVGTYVPNAMGALALFKCRKVMFGFHSIYPFFASGLQSPIRAGCKTNTTNTNV